jgi:hypothetical protein
MIHAEMEGPYTIRDIEPPKLLLKSADDATHDGHFAYVGKAQLNTGALGEIRTPDPRIRSPMLYPAELRARGARTIAG